MKQFLLKSRRYAHLLKGACFAFTLALLLAGPGAKAQLALSETTPMATIDFSASMPATVGNGSYAGAGFAPNPTTAGQLNSNAWAVTGWSDGALTFGGTRTTSNTDYTRGTASASVTTAGMYAFTGTPHSTSNPLLLIQPGGSDFAPGTLTLRIQNTGTTPLTELAVSYNLYVRNDQARANSFNFSYSTDNATYTPVAALDYTSPEAAATPTPVALAKVDGAGGTPSRSTTITGISIAPNDFIYIRWNSADVSGSGSRDEFGLDDITVAATFTAPATPTINISPSTLAFGSVPVNTTTTAPYQTYTVSASGLTDNLVLLASSQYEISLTNDPNTFSSSVTITPAAGTVSSTTVYVRFSPTAGGSQPGTITNSSTNAATQTVNISGSGACPTPTVTALGPTTFCNGGSVTLSSSPGNSYSWSTGATTQTITVSSSGSYNVTVNTGPGCTTTSASTPVTVTSFSRSGILYSENIGNTPVAGTPVVGSFTGWQNSAPVTYTSTTSTQSDVRSTLPSTGDYPGASGGNNVYMGSGDRNFIISGINTTNYDNLILRFGLLRENTTNNMTVAVSADGVTYTPLTISQPAANNVYALTTASGTIPSTSNLRIRFAKSGTTGFRIDDVQLLWSLTPVTQVTITASGPTAICSGSSVTLSSNIPDNNTWSTGATTSSITVNTAGTYTLTNTDANGCTSTASVTVTVNPNPVASASSNGPVCSNSTLMLMSDGGSTYSWVGPNGFMSPQQNPQINNATTAASGTYSVYVANAQGCTDMATTSVTVLATQTLSGTYTLDQNAPASATNFTSFSALAQALSTSCGVSGPVTVNVAAGSGPYTDQFLLTEIIGSSTTNTVTINGNGNILTLCSNDPLNRDIVRLDGTDNITINGLTLTATCGYGWGVHVMGDVSNVTISNNTINLMANYSVFIGNMAGIIAAGSLTNPAAPSGTINGLTISGNTVNNGFHGIRINGNSAANRAMGVVIDGNTVNDAAQYGIYLIHAMAPVVNDNNVDMRTAGFTRSFGIWLAYIEGGITVTRNSVINAGETGMWLHGINNFTSTRGLVANNMIGGGFRGTTGYGLVLNFAYHLDVYYNSTNVDVASGAAAILMGENMNVLNNSFAYAGGGDGYAVKAPKAEHFLTIDYNNYYSNGSKFVHYAGADRATLADMQTAPGPLNHNMNSMDVNPMYVSATNLHLMSGSPLIGQGTTVAGVTTDFDNQARTTPTDIGADEWSSGTRTAAAGEHQMLVYPNPFVNELTVELSGAAGQVQLVLTDMTGRQIYHSSFAAAEGTAQVQVRVADNLPQGVYLLQLRHGDVVSQQRVVKQ